MANINIDKIQMKRGTRANIPVLSDGEPAICLDTKEFAIGTPEGNIYFSFQDLSDLVNEVGNAKGGYSSLQEKLSSLVSSGGSGSLVYQTLADLQTAYPNGTTQPAWIVADNAWYYWSGAIITDTTAPILTITAGGTFTGTKSVTMSVNETADIYYTIDGSTPTTSSMKYTSALSITATTTLKAFAKDTAGNSSAVQTVTYTLDAGAPADTTAPTVTASPAAGTYTSAQSVTLTANETATIYYTTNGTTPTTASAVYTGPISISATTTLQFIGKDTAGNTSTPVVATYTINIPDTNAPVLTITPAGTFTDTQTVTMSANETATIWYTVDGSDPTSSGTKVQYSTPVTLTATTTVKAYAVDSANNASAVQTITYTKTTVPAGTIVSDSFNRADSTTSMGVAETGQTWQKSSTGVFGIINNTAYKSSGTGWEGAYIPINSRSYAAQVTIQTLGTGYRYLYARYVDTGNVLGVQISGANGGYYLQKRVGGVATTITNFNKTAVVGDVVKLVQATDGTITVYINGTQVGTPTLVTDHLADTNNVGIGGTSTDVRFDDFSVTV